MCSILYNYFCIRREGQVTLIFLTIKDSKIMSREVSYKLRVKICSGDSAVDMKPGIESIDGSSDVSRILAEYILRNRVPGRLNEKSPVLTELEKGLRGSYMQDFKLIIKDPELKQRALELGNEVFFELFKSLLHEALHLDTAELSTEANRQAQTLDGELRPKLIRRLRGSLKRMHKTQSAYNFNVDFQRRKPDTTDSLILLDQRSLDNLTSTTVTERVEEGIATVNRFNSFTGNGRLLLIGEQDTVSFGLSSEPSLMTLAKRRIVSENLHENNGVQAENRSFLSIRFKRLVLPTGDTVKLLIQGVEKVEE